MRQLHRWIGLFASLWILQLALTGLLLQQSDALSLDRRYVQSARLLTWFGYGHKTQAFSHHNQQLYQIDDRVVINDQYRHFPQTIDYAAFWNNSWVVATAQSVYRLNLQGDIEWRLDDFDGLPTPVDNLHVDDRVRVLNQQQWFIIRDDLKIEPIRAPVEAVNHAQKRPLTDTERQQVLPQALRKVLSYDKVLADIHAGYKGSVWLNTLTALALLYLALSGIILFFKPKSSSRQRSQ